MPNDSHDQLFEDWGRAFNVDAQLGKTVYHMESSGGRNTGRSLKDDPDSPIGPMQMRPSTAAMVAKQIGVDGPIDLQDMRFAVPLAMAYLSQGVQHLKSAEGALGFYYSGSLDPHEWGPKTAAYIAKGQATYPQMGLKLPTPAQPAQAAATTPQDQPNG